MPDETLIEEKIKAMKTKNGFLAALDQSGGSTPGALMNYGIPPSEYTTDTERDALVHEMRVRIINAPDFNGQKILGAILFWDTMLAALNETPLPQYLWEELDVLSFLKIDVGMAEENDGVQMLKTIPEMEERLIMAIKLGVCGTKMRSVIQRASKSGINELVMQQFDIGQTIARFGLVPIIEPEVNIANADKGECEAILKEAILNQLDSLPEDLPVALKLTLPEESNAFADLIAHPKVIRVTALSGGYDRNEACQRLEQNSGMIASFSRALTEGLKKDQTDKEFNTTLNKSIDQIYQASIT